ncbi:amino acid adenylation domain-containing protein [Tumebacillus sp. BK434]|uniref:non-ribosomal peptide synthetase/type I polyketide synthase n=1 Tax=Tumebacillus sp. BK434 TaxID=2512169 RepID=UPI0010527E6B|nr:non-ribosomal peptide synthetase/type I polyketide synthase [Tumebacillus sp. BK434]TCP54571.1 amino acid adenylation domain-containing protein [Tumebacillus sp. BK434]
MTVLYAFPVSFAQQRLWLADGVLPGSSAYHMPSVLQIEGDLDEEALRLALTEIVHRHESLRTTFGMLDNQLMQKVHTERDQELTVVDLRDVPQAERRAEVERLTHEELVRPFDLSAGPLLRTTLYKLAAQEHVLMVNMHHIVSDGWSIGILIRELTALYTAFAAGEESPLEPLAIQYADYSQWQRDDLESGVLEEHMAYWRDKLGGELPVLQLPTDRPRPPYRTDAGDYVHVQLSSQLSEGIKEAGRKEQATLFMTLLAAYQVLLSRYSGQEDVLVGSPIAGREQSDLHGLIGFFVNNLVLRSDLSGNPTFLELLAQVRKTALEAYQHAEVPFDMLIQELVPERDVTVSPLFQTMFVLNDELAQLALPELSMSYVDLDIRSVKYDLALEVIDATEGMQIIWRYKTDLFDRATIERMSANFVVLLEGIVEAPEQQVALLPLLTAAEHQQVKNFWNEGAVTVYPDKTLHVFFEEQAERTPDRTAVVFEGESVTYREFNERANRLASRLLKLGVQANEFVGVSMERSIEMLVAVYAVVKAGGAYVPIDPTNPPERVAYILADAQARVLLTQEYLLERLPVLDGTQVICVDREDFAAENPANPDLGVTTDQLAYMIYTSGSTGKPKGAMVPHKAIVNQILWRQETYRLTESDCILQKTPVSFDASVWELFWALMVGARIVMARSEGHKDSAYLREVIKEQGVTTVHFVPSMLQIFAEEKGIEECTSLRRILCGGEALPADLQARVFARLPHVELHNLYGPTEAAVDVTYWFCERDSDRKTVPIGRHIANTELYVLDKHLQPVPLGAAGELHIGGVQLAYGYHNRPELTAEKFIANPFGAGKLYKSGDLVRLLPDGVFEYLGRLDHQVKIRGFRVELGEIEALLTQHPHILEAVVLPKGDALAAYVVTDGAAGAADAQELRRYLQETLPVYMVPGSFAFLDKLPLTPNGKADRQALLKLETVNPVPEAAYVPPQSELEQGIAAIWQEVLEVEQVGLYDNFFELGGHSLAIMRVHRRLQEKYAFEISVVQLFQYPTIKELAEHFSAQRSSGIESGQAERADGKAERTARPAGERQDIAVIGMAGRFPGADDVEAFWRNLHDGVESIRQFTDEELLAEGHDPDVLQAQNYVKAGGYLGDIEYFDADFFGINPREAEVMDPQHRIFLETAWEALETAGYDSEAFDGDISVFGGAGLSRYLLVNLVPNRHLAASVGEHTVMIGNGADHMVGRVAYKLNLTGMSHAVSATCSTGMVAIHQAAQSLRNGDCDMALAGAVGLAVPQKNGYFHVEGGISSPDGHCRTFDADAQGTVPGSGAGIVVLKRLDDALRDGDRVLAVLKGSAVTNDGSRKVGYTAPSVDGQKAVILKALQKADVEPESVSYIEAHGTATPLGDPIELTALTQAYRTLTERERFIAIGSVKSNIGHLDAAAGAAGFIKTVLALQHEKLPPSLHFRKPNPKINWERSPFYVNTELRDWSRGDRPRRAGVSSFGLGGMNSHAILEEAPLQASSATLRPAQLLVLSAKTETALEAATANLQRHLAQHPEQKLADVAYTLQLGRRPFAHRRALVVTDHQDAVEVLANLHPRRVLQGQADLTDHPRKVAFLFAGTGDHYVEMAAELYRTEPVFKQAVDQCCEILEPHLDTDVKKVLYPQQEQNDIPSGLTKEKERPQDQAAPAFDLRKMLRREEGADLQQLHQTEYAHPALFVIEYALTQLLLAWGIRPQALLGYSLGEYVAACVAGVFSLEDALALVAKRAKMIQDLPAGAMLAVPMGEEELRPLLSGSLSLATINTHQHCVVSGTKEAVAELEQELLAQGIACLPVKTSHAFHSQLMEPLAEPFAKLVQSFNPQAPHTPFVSNVTGTWITAEEATDPAYWARHLCQTVRFADGVRELCQDQDLVLLEIGPGQTLTSFALQLQSSPGRIVLPTLRPAYEKRSDTSFLLSTIGQLWLAGVPINWKGMYLQEQRLRVALPTYPFERKRYWIQAKQGAGNRLISDDHLLREQDLPSTAKLETGHARPQLATAYVGASSREEQAIVSIFQELLGIQGVGVHDNFFQLGGNSLLGTQLMSRLRSTFGIDLPLRTLFERETAAELAEIIAEQTVQAPSVASAVSSGIPRRPDEVSPLSFSQERIWVMEQLAPDQAVYNIPSALEMTGPLDLDILERSINEVIMRHETLRSTFQFADGEPFVAYLPAFTLTLGVEDLRDLPDDERRAEAVRLAADLARAPFDLPNGPLLRATAMRMADDKHMLVLVIHHIIADGWSLGVLISEIAKLYAAFAQGAPSPLTGLPLQYGDFAHWQKLPEQQAALDSQLAYWKRQLGDAHEPLALPTDRPRPAVQTYNGARTSFTLSKPLSDALQQVSAREGTTLYMTLLAAFQTLLARYSGQSDILVGSPIAGRSLRETEELIGVFVNTLVLRGRVEDGMSFRDLLAQVRQTSIDAFAHQDLPFEKLVAELQPERNMGVSPLFQVMFNMLNAPLKLTVPGGLTLETVELNSGTAKFDITLAMSEREHGLIGEWEYNTDLFDAATIDRMIGHFQTLLEQVVERPDRQLQEIPLLSPAEQQLMLRDWNDTGAPYREDACLHHLFEEQAERTPDATALVFEDEELSFAELNNRANRLAAQLQAAGVGPDDPIGICMERSLELVTAMLAAHKAGGAYLPLDPGYPQERLAFMIADAKPKAILTQPALAAKLPGSAAQLLTVTEAAQNELYPNLASPVRPDHLAYIIYTSGSTGQPKGVQVTHGNAVNHFAGMDRAVGCSEQDVMLAVTSIGFDISVPELFWTMSCGAKVVLLSEREILEAGISSGPYALSAQLERHCATMLQGTPSFIGSLTADAAGLTAAEQLQKILLGGEALPPLLADRLKTQTNARIFNLYGPTEATVYATAYEVQATGQSAIPLGRPLANHELYILDRHLQPVPIGVKGELHIGGLGLAKGYLGREELTLERFIPNPFGAGRLYKTGDLASYLPDGTVLCHGRLDQQVKVRGHRIEPGEVEAALLLQSGIREAVVVARDNTLLAYVVGDSGDDLDTDALYRSLRGILPAYMVPGHIVPLDRLPLTPNGKIDRRALPAPFAKARKREYVAPDTATEKLLTGLWAELLKLEPEVISVHDNFFHIGGHSLLATHVIARVHRELGVELPLRVLFEQATIAELAQCVEQTETSQDAPIVRRERVRSARKR